jgi:purine-binding chemotaxis protein CheW
MAVLGKEFPDHLLNLCLHILVADSSGNPDGGVRLVQTEFTDQKVVVFRVGREEYAVTITAVKEVVTWMKPTPVPDSPAAIDGVVDLRGDVIPVVDLAGLFRTTRQNADSDSRIIVMEVGGQQAGFVVDDVTEVHTVAAGTVSPPSPVLRITRLDGAGGTVVSGILKMGESRLVVLVDPGRILATAQIA